MKNRPYYSIRTGKNPHVKYDVSVLRRLLYDVYTSFRNENYFQEYFGYHCEDRGRVPGLLGLDIDAQVFRKLRKENLWPIDKYRCSIYSEDDIFDLIEFLFDCVSKPLEGYYHDWNQCGWHYEIFNGEQGRVEFRKEINEILLDYADGYELSKDGEILTLAKKGLNYIFQANLPDEDPENIEGRVDAATLKFRRYHSSMEDRRDAIRDLADVLEFLRPKVKQVLTSPDEKDLFNIANNFGIRHHNDKQKTDYDKPIWYSWMFYYYLSTIHAALRLIEKQQKNSFD